MAVKHCSKLWSLSLNGAAMQAFFEWKIQMFTVDSVVHRQDQTHQKVGFLVAVDCQDIRDKQWDDHKQVLPYAEHCPWAQGKGETEVAMPARAFHIIATDTCKSLWMQLKTQSFQRNVVLSRVSQVEKDNPNNCFTVIKRAKCHLPPLHLYP